MVSIRSGIKNFKQIIPLQTKRRIRYYVIGHRKPREELGFEFSLTQHCDLNCVGCTHFAPLAEPEFADYEESARDFARLSALFHGHIEWIHLMGGEPLLHPDRLKFFKMARESFPDATIELVTNGLKLLNQSKEFWLACKENRITIRPTKYPIPLDFVEMEKRAADYGVEYHYYNEKMGIKTMNLFKMDIKGRQDKKKNFFACGQASQCVQLEHGRLYTCSVVPSARHFNKYFGEDLKVSPKDSIDIYQARSAREILNFLSKPIPFCRYCALDETVMDQTWRQSERAIEEWA